MRPNFPPQTAQRLTAPLQGCRLPLRIVSSGGPSVHGARFLLTAAFRADVEHAFGVVASCEVSRRVRKTFAEPDPHLPSPDAKLQTCLVSAAEGSARVRNGFRASGLQQLRWIPLVGTADIVSPAIGLSDCRQTRGFETLCSIVRWVSVRHRKGLASYTEVYGIFSRRPLWHFFPSPNVPQACAGRPRPRRDELLISRQSALIRRKPGTLRKC
jgi:hypothetical protein